MDLSLNPREGRIISFGLIVTNRLESCTLQEIHVYLFLFYFYFDTLRYNQSTEGNVA